MQDVTTQHFCTLLHNLPSTFTYPARKTKPGKKWKADASANLETESDLIISKLPKKQLIRKQHKKTIKCKISFFIKLGSSHNTLTLFDTTGNL